MRAREKSEHRKNEHRKESFMAIPEYSKARKLAQKAYRQDLEARRNPYLQVLDALLPYVETAG